MKTIVLIIGKLLLKVVALIVLPFLIFIHFLYNITGFVIRHAALGVAVIAGLIGAYDCYKYGFSMESGWYILACIVCSAIYFFLPMLPIALIMLKHKLSDILYAPLIVRSPVKYTF